MRYHGLETMTDAIHYFQPELLRREMLESLVYPAPQDLYWSDSFEPSFYKELARAGFISVCVRDGDCHYLIPEIQSDYAVLAWPDIHVGRQMRRVVRSGTLEHQDVVLRVSRDPCPVLDGIRACHGQMCWLHAPYLKLVQDLAAQPDTDFHLFGVELRSRSRNLLIGGELGYAIGGVWTSLSGFLYRDHPAWNHFGTVQLLCLASLLESCGYAFWNLGHPHMPYKMEIGAKILPRKEFLGMWRAGLDHQPRVGLISHAGTDLPAVKLLGRLQAPPS
jgi:hypothetical protein